VAGSTLDGRPARISTGFELRISRSAPPSWTAGKPVPETAALDRQGLALEIDGHAQDHRCVCLLRVLVRLLAARPPRARQKRGEHRGTDQERLLHDLPPLRGTRRVGRRFDARQDPAYVALGELGRRLLVDRGPFEIPKAGIPYLSTEGYPYHLFHEAHPELVAAAQGLSLGSAAEKFLEAYLNGVVFAGVRKLSTLFGAFLSPAEIERALAQLSRQGRVALAGTGQREVAIAAKESR
jgi:hypothetical protein